MKSIIRPLSLLVLIAGVVVSSTSCSDDKDDVNTSGNTNASIMFAQEDQVGRPAINTVFVDADKKDAFNTSIPSEQGAMFQSSFEARLMALNAGYTTNLLGLDAASFTGVLATDVLSVSLDGTTTFYDGTNVLTGRALADDVVDVEFILVFGGPNATLNPGLTSDNVDQNDKAFLSTFPYLAAPF